MEHSLLGVDVELKVAQKIQSQQSGSMRVGRGIVHGGGKVLDLHAAYRDRVEISQRSFNDAIGSVKRDGLGISAHVDRQIAGKGVGNKSKTGTGIDDELGGLTIIQGRLDDHDVAISFKRDRCFAWWGLDFRFRDPRTFLGLNPIGVTALLGRYVMQIVGNMQHAVVVDPAIVFRGRDRRRS